MTLDRVVVENHPMFHQMQVEEVVPMEILVVMESLIIIMPLEQVAVVVLAALVVMEAIVLVEQVVMELDFHQYSMIQELHQVQEQVLMLAVDWDHLVLLVDIMSQEVAVEVHLKMVVVLPLMMVALVDMEEVVMVVINKVRTPFKTPEVVAVDLKENPILLVSQILADMVLRVSFFLLTHQPDKYLKT